jgi:hypothetical protein
MTTGTLTKCRFFLKAVTLILLTIVLLFSKLSLSGNPNSFPAQITVQGIGSYRSEVIEDTRSGIFLTDIRGLLEFLRIEHTISFTGDTIRGYTTDQKKIFQIDAKRSQIISDGIRIPVQRAQIIKVDSMVFLATDLYKELFGLYLSVNRLTRTTEIKSYSDNIIFRKLTDKEIKHSLPFLGPSGNVDSVITREYHFFRPGTIDWAIRSMQSVRKPISVEADLGLGIEFLGGEATALLNYSKTDGFREESQQYHWRWVNNHIRFINQIWAGKINTGSLTEISNSTHGFMISNEGTRFEPLEGTYRITDYTQPGWTVKLFVNNVFVASAISDAAGFYFFDVPKVYGSSSVKLRFFGPYGEERHREKSMAAPFTLVKPGKVEYQLSGGVSDFNSLAGFGRGLVQLGLFPFMTLGGGFEYLYDPETSHQVPLVQGTFHPVSGLFFSANYDHDVRTRGQLLYQIPHSMAFEVQYTGFESGQKLIPVKIREELSFSVSSPVTLFGKTGFTAGSFRWANTPSGEKNLAELIYSTTSGKFSPHLAGHVSWEEGTEPALSALVASGIKLGSSTQLRPSVYFDITNREVLHLRAGLEHRILRSGYLSLYAGRDVKLNKNILQFELSYDIPFARAGFSARMYDQITEVAQSISGSFMTGSGKAIAGSDMMAGKAGLMIIPFIDLNHNGIFDESEPVTNELSLRINNGHIKKKPDDAAIYITGLESHSIYFIEFEASGSETQILRPGIADLTVETDPNQFKRIYIPLILEEPIIRTDSVSTGTGDKLPIFMPLSEESLKTDSLLMEIELDIEPDLIEPVLIEIDITKPEIRKKVSEMYFLQTGAYAREKPANEQAVFIREASGYTTRIIFRDKLYKICAGPFATLKETLEAQKILSGKKIDSFVIHPGTVSEGDMD